MSSFLERKDALFLVMVSNLIVRLLIALLTNLGNDEVYYVSYALYPDWSYFDHPPMVGLLINLTSLHLVLYDELFIRLGALIIGTLNLYLIYRIGKLICDHKTGLIAVLLASVSLYSSIMVGTFILPDTPQSLFWLTSIFFFVKYIKNPIPRFLLLFGLFVGLAMLSKYHAVFLWLGAFLYFLFLERKGFIRWELWVSGIISLVLFVPVVWWNMTSEFTGIGYHSDRVGNDSWLPSFDFVLQELIGQILYNNPFNVVLIVSSLVILGRNLKKYLTPSIGFLISTGFPLVLVTLFMSLYNRTFPHWSGPAYFSLILIAAFIYKNHTGKLLKRVIIGGQALFILIVIVGLIEIQTGIFTQNNHHNDPTKIGKNDVTLDLKLWNTIADSVQVFIEDDIKQNSKPEDYVIFSQHWFPTAHIDYYIALPNQKPLYSLGSAKAIHHYKRINGLRGKVELGTNAYFITTSRRYREPPVYGFLDHFATQEKQVIPIYQSGYHKVNVFIWKLENLEKELVF